MRRLVLAVSFISLLFLIGCPSNNGGSGDEDTGNIEADTGMTADGETSDADAGEPDGASEDGGSSGCSYQSDCGDDEICHDSTCKKAKSCIRAGGWASCVRKVGKLDTDLAKRAYCDGDYCRVACTLDSHCPDGEICTDNGKCRQFDGDLSADDPGGSSQKPVEAGVGEELMHFPIGLSLGGYGSRAANDAGRYVESLRATHGQMHGLYARAFVLDNGERKLLFVRLPIIFPTAALHEAVARKLQKKTGKNWRNSLMISGTHTHSGPARFFQLPDDALLPLGSFGTDEFHDQAFQWLTESTFKAAEKALSDLSPAKVGVSIVEDFDGDDEISSDRWNQTPQFDDNRLLLIRIDDMNDKPRAVAISFGTHGTIHSEDYFTGDSLSGIERGLEKALAEEYGKSVPVMYFNQNGGTMSPRGDGDGHEGPQRFEKLGHDFAADTLGEIENMQTKRSFELDGTTYRFPISYDRLGYGEQEWGDNSLDTIDNNYEYGGIQCKGDDEDSDPSTHIAPDDLSCLGIHRLIHHRPPTLFMRSQMSAFKIGAKTLVTAPGELSMELSWQIVRRLKKDHGLDPLKTWTFGFAQDHQFYLVPTNLRGGKPPYPGYEGPKAPGDYPDWAFSYLQGGYEPSMSFWGWKFGDYLVERASRTVAKLENKDFERKLPTVLPTQFSPYGQEDFPVEKSDKSKVGNAVEKPPKTVQRFEAVEYAWVGGDPGAEMPQSPKVTLERKSGGSFSAVETERMRSYDNRAPVMLTRLRKEGDNWVWVVRWEELRDFPAGTYRFAVEGHYKDNAGRTSYTTESREFELVPSDKLDVKVQANAGKLEGTFAYPAAEELQYKAESKDPGHVIGNYRMRDPRVPTGLAVPLVVGTDVTASDVEILIEQNGSQVAKLSGSDVTLATTNTNRGGEANVPTSTFEASPSGLASGNYDVTVTLTDAYGNTGKTTKTLQLGN